MFGCPPQLKDTADPKSAGIANGRAALDQSGLKEESDPSQGLGRGHRSLSQGPSLISKALCTDSTSLAMPFPLLV